MDINWIIKNMQCFTTYDQQQDVVFLVDYVFQGKDGDYIAESFNTQALPIDISGGFTPFADLTQDQVVGWIKAVLGDTRVAEMTANMERQIESLKNPPIVTKTPPWD